LTYFDIKKFSILTLIVFLILMKIISSWLSQSKIYISFKIYSDKWFIIKRGKSNAHSYCLKAIIEKANKELNANE
jgi:hypothetical protein